MTADALGGFTDPRPGPSAFKLTPLMDHSDWAGLVASAVARIGRGELSKVVLARQVTVTANHPFITPEILSRLPSSHPTSMIFRIDSFLGASPELLIERRGTRVASHPMAGTVGRSGDPATDEKLIAGLLASPKQRSEHSYVTDGIRSTFRPVCDRLDVPDEPAVLRLPNVCHLATRMSAILSVGPDELVGPHGRVGRMRVPSGNEPAHPGLRVPGALELVARVHPSAAVAGTPTDAAVAYIAEVEGFDRGRFAGPVGWMDARGDGSWAIGLRSADVHGDRASIYAGAGVVAGSRPGTELEETWLKLQALLAALVRP
jgi:menaquinone-specific isochorismate synthase